MALAHHNDSGYIEQVIHAARHRVAAGQSDDEIIEEMLAKNVSIAQAIHAIAAAKILLQDEQ